MKNNQIKSVFSTKKELDGKFINLCFEKRTRFQLDVLEINNLFKQLVDGIDLTNIKRSRIFATEIDVIKFIHGMFIYSNSESRISDLYHNLIFDFYIIKDISWVKNRIQWLKHITTDKSTFERIISLVRAWNPEKNPSEYVFEQFKTLGIYLTDAQKIIYNSIYKMDYDKWIKSDISSLMKNTSSSDIFYNVVKNASIYKDMKSGIYMWCYDNTYEIDNNTSLYNHDHMIEPFLL